LPEEERIKIQNKKEAEAAKKKGNELYMKKKFAEALAAYSEAIAKDPEEITYHTNKAAVYFEMKDYDACIESCEGGIEIAKKGNYDYVKLSKAMARKANALVQKG
jgi:stress-induced-phosphoprotein 1